MGGDNEMKRHLRFPTLHPILLLLSAVLLGAATAGCSKSEPDFASMSKDEQIKAMHNLPPEEVAIQKKMLAGILAAKNAGSGKPSALPVGVAPTTAPGAGQH